MHLVHLDGFDVLSADATARLVAAESLAQISRGDRYKTTRITESLLNYPSFFEDAFPALHESWNVDLAPGRVSYRSYRDSLTLPGCDQAQWSDHRSRSTNIRQISDSLEARIALLMDPGNGKSPLG